MYKILFFMDDKESVQVLTSMLPEEFFPVGAYSGVKDVLDFLDRNWTDVIIIDTAVRQEVGLELVRKLYRRRKRPDVLMLCDYREMEYARRASEYGVEYLRTDIPHEHIRRVLNPDFNAEDYNLATDTRWVQDVRGKNYLIFPGEWTINWALERNENLQLQEFNEI